MKLTESPIHKKEPIPDEGAEKVRIAQIKLQYTEFLLLNICILRFTEAKNDFFSGLPQAIAGDFFHTADSDCLTARETNAVLIYDSFSHIRHDIFICQLCDNRQ